MVGLKAEGRNLSLKMKINIVLSVVLAIADTNLPYIYHMGLCECMLEGKKIYS